MFRGHFWKFFKLLWTPLMRAVDKGQTEIVKMLVEQKGIDINAKTV